MRAIVSVLFMLGVFVGAAQAQPGQPPLPPAEPEAAPPPPYPPEPPPYPPQPYGQPYPPQPYGQPYPPQPYLYPPQALTPAEQKLLAEGEISLGAHAGGVALNWFFGFGIGQAVQGRWNQTGWMFTLGEAAGIGLVVAGFARLDFSCDSSETSCNNDGAGALIAGGFIGYLVVHAWSIVDAAMGPADHNRKVRNLKRRLGMSVEASRIIPYATPAQGGGGTAGLVLRF